MLTELAIVVLIAAIVVLFFNDFIEFIKKIFTFPGAALLLPIIFASSLVIYYEPWIFGAVYIIKIKLHNLYILLASALSFPGGAILAAVLILMLFSVLPVFLISVYYWRNFYREFLYSYMTSFLIWIFCVALLVF